MQKTILFLLCLSSLGCAVHFSNTKTIKGEATKVLTPYGVVDNASIVYKSSLDLWFPWKMENNSENP